MRFEGCREGYCVVPCVLVCFGAEVGSWFGTENMGYMVGVVAGHMVQTEVVDLVGRKVWIEVVAAVDRMARIEAEGRMTKYFAVRKPVLRDERKRRRTAAGWGRKYSAGLDNCFARCSVYHLVDQGTFDFAAGHSCPAAASDGAHDVRPVAQRRRDCSGCRHFDLTSCCVHIRVVMWWNVKSSDRTVRTLKTSDRIGRPPCDPKSWYLHHLEAAAASAAASSFHVAHSKNQLDNHTLIVVVERNSRPRGIRIDLSSVFLAVYR